MPVPAAAGQCTDYFKRGYGKRNASWLLPARLFVFRQPAGMSLALRPGARPPLRAAASLRSGRPRSRSRLRSCCLPAGSLAGAAVAAALRSGGLAPPGLPCIRTSGVPPRRWQARRGVARPLLRAHAFFVRSRLCRASPFASGSALAVSRASYPAFAFLPSGPATKGARLTSPFPLRSPFLPPPTGSEMQKANAGHCVPLESTRTGRADPGPPSASRVVVSGLYPCCSKKGGFATERHQVKFRGTHLTDASGSLVGVTYSHNRGGAYTRGRTVPVNPNTVQQQLIRSLFAGVQSSWSALSAAQRSAWDSYALATPITNSLGASVNVGGKGMFTRGNVPRLQALLTQVSAGPVISGLPALTAPGITSITASTGIMITTFTNTDSWATAVGGALLVFMSRPQSPTINGFKGPYRFAGRILGAVSPPTSPMNITSPFALAAGQRVFVRFVAVTADGRLSGDVRTFSLTV